MQKETIEITRTEITKMINHYLESEKRGNRLMEEARKKMELAKTEEEKQQQKVIYEMYLYQNGKSAGFKEAYMEMIFKEDGKFPKLEE